MPRRPRGTARRVGGAALAGLLVLSVTSCSRSEDSADRPEASASSSAAEPEVTTTLSWGEVRGSLGPRVRAEVLEQVGATVDAWIDAAYAGDLRPRVADAFPGFTPDAAALAEADRAVMSNAVLDERVEDVEVRERRVQLDALAADGAAAGVTARVNLVMDLGGTQRSERVSGRLLLSPTPQGGWRIFGYVMDRGAA